MGAPFNLWGDFGLYCIHLPEAIQIHDVSTDWYWDSARAVACALINIPDRSAIFDNFIFNGVFIAFLKLEPLTAEFWQIMLFSLFRIRAQSEGSPTIRGSNSDNLAYLPETSRKSTIGIRHLGGEDRLLLKLRTRTISVSHLY